MIVATALECSMLAVMLAAADARTRVVGAILWVAYFYYSASLCSLRAFARWLHDLGEGPPGGAA